MMKRLLLISFFLVFLLFALAPPLCLLGGALFPEGTLSFESYKSVLLNERQIGLLSHSVVVGLLTTLFACVVGIPVGVILSRLRFPFDGILRFFYLIPVMLPTYVIGIAWTDHIPFYGLPGIVFLLGLSYWPIVALFTEKGMRSVGSDLEDAARLMAPPGRVFSTITFRIGLPSILTGALFVFVFAVSDFSIPDLLSFTSSTSYQVFSSEVFYRWDKLRRAGEAAAASLPLVVLCLAALCLILHLEGRTRKTSLTGRFKPREPRRAGIKDIPLVGFMIVAVFMSVIVPIATLYLWLGRKGGLGEMATVLFNSLTDTGPDAFNSVFTSIVAAFFMALVGFFLAYTIERSQGWKRWAASFLVLLPITFPAVMVGVSEIRFWNHPWNPLSDLVYDRPPMLVFTYFARFIPIAVLSFRSSLGQVDRSLEEASLVSGRGFLFTVKRILLPLSWRGFWVAFLLGYILSMRELDTIAVVGAGNDTLPFRIYSQIHTSRDVIIAAHCIVLIMTLLIPPLIYRLLVRGRVKIV